MPFRRLLTAYSHADPAPSPQLALPANTIKAAGMHYQAVDARTRATADLVTTAYFFLLRVAEFTMPRPNARTRTFQFRVQDVTFRRADDTVIPHHGAGTINDKSGDFILRKSEEWTARHNSLVHRDRILVLPSTGPHPACGKRDGVQRTSVYPFELCPTWSPCDSGERHCIGPLGCRRHESSCPRLRYAPRG